MMKRLFTLSGIALLIFFSACETSDMDSTPPEDLLDEATYLDVFTEMELLKVYQKRDVPYTFIDSLYDEILIKYDVDGLAFLSSHRYYQGQIAEQTRRVDSVIARLERELEKMDQADSLATQ